MWLNRYAKVVAGATFLLLVAGASVTSTGSGLAVPDWPLSYGTLTPPMVGGILFEHGHRMIAATVGLLVLVLAVWLARSREPRWIRRLGVLAAGLVIAQGLLGGLTVLLLLPPPVSVAHAALAMAFFTLATLLATFTSRPWKESGAPAVPAGGVSLPRFCLGVTFLVYFQILVGALVRHTGSGLAFRDFPLMNGTLFPRIPSYLEAFQLAHRVMALVVLVAIGALASVVRRRHPGETRLRTLAVLASVLLVVQILLGAASVWTGLKPAVTVAHHAVGALLLATLAAMTAWSHRRLAPRVAIQESVSGNAGAGRAPDEGIRVREARA